MKITSLHTHVFMYIDTSGLHYVATHVPSVALLNQVCTGYAHYTYFIENDFVWSMYMYVHTH